MKNTSTSEPDAIRTRPCPNCYICGTKGNILYKGLKDRLFGSTGKWNFKVCHNTDCGFGWLDPAPLEEDLSRTYIDYYTHHESIDNRKKKKLCAEMLRWPVKWVVSILKRLTLIHHERKRIELMYLHNIQPGKLLEVGCGTGKRLAMIQNLGWEVEGQEIDPQAAENARKVYGLPIRLGALKDLAFPEGLFDAVMMNHVIEHVYDPLSLLTECRRILRPGGVIVITTPNFNSYGHGYFKHHWRGLEPPRHLHIFSIHALRRIVIQSGFNKIRAWTTSARAEAFAVASFEIKQNRPYRITTHAGPINEIKAMLFQIWARIVQMIRPDSGDECILMAEK